MARSALRGAWLSRRAGGGRPGRFCVPSTITVCGGVIHGPQVLSTMVRSEELDLGALDSARQATVMAALTQLCRTVDVHLQLLIQVRPWPLEPPPVALGGGIAGQLRAAGADHERARLCERPSFRRTILLIPAVGGGSGAIAELQAAVRRVRRSLDAAGVGGVVLDDRAMAAVIADGWGGAEVEAVSSGYRVSFPLWEERAQRVSLGDMLLQGLSLRRLPGVAVQPGWLRPLLDVRAACDISLHLDPVTTPAALARLSRRLRHLRADQLIDLDRGNLVDARVEVGLESALELRGRLARNEGKALRLSLTAVARANSVAELVVATDQLRGAFAATLAQSCPAHLQQLAAVLSCSPLGHDVLAHGKLVDTAAAATCAPWVEATCRDAGGYHLGWSCASGTPVRLAPFDDSRHPNANIAIFAASGHGKSYAIGAVVLEALASGIGSVLIDPEGEYEHLIRAVGGEYIVLRPGSGSAFNIFDALIRLDDGESSGAIVDLINVLCSGTLDDVERAHVDAAVQTALRSAATRGRPPVLGDCLGNLAETAPRVQIVLNRFCSGPLGELFNRPTSVQLSKQLVGISLRDLRNELLPAATLIVAEWLWSLVRYQQCERHIIFDEVGLLCAHPPLRTLLVQLARRCRKYRASLVVATQNVGDLLATDDGRVIATNPAIVLLGGHRTGETALMQAAFGLTTGQRHQLESTARGEFLLLAGDRRLPMAIDCSPLHHALLTRSNASIPDVLADLVSGAPAAETMAGGRP